ncbi:MAG: hypothetical protein KGJ57_17040, partial [Sphingomonadales bacterium]|nr:hypothetical protein [Sphingomonadales bacterium]
ILFQQDSADKPGDGLLVGEWMAHSHAGGMASTDTPTTSVRRLTSAAPQGWQVGLSAASLDPYLLKPHRLLRTLEHRPLPREQGLQIIRHAPDRGILAIRPPHHHPYLA